MGLEQTVVSGVAAAKAALAGAGGLLTTVTVETCTGTDGDGKKTYAAPVPYEALVWTYEGVSARTKVSRVIGDEDVDGPKIFFFESLTVTTKDRITLQDGTRPPISTVLSIPRRSGGFFFVEVRCGRPERGVIS